MVVLVDSSAHRRLQNIIKPWIRVLPQFVVGPIVMGPRAGLLENGYV